MMRRLHVLMLVSVLLLIVGLAGCASSPYSLDDVGNIATLGMWGGIHRPGIPDPYWPVADTAPEDLKAGISALEWGGVARIDSAIKHLQQAVADHPCDATAHFYLGVAYAAKAGDIHQAWEQRMEQQAGRVHGYSSFVPEGDSKFYDNLYESQMGPTLQPLRQTKGALLARAGQLRRGEVAACRR